MNRTQLEALVLSIADRVAAKQSIEDSRVELKVEWPSDPKKAARQLAGLANAARGEPIVWIVGLDEKKGIVGAVHAELANWLPAVQAWFDDALAPTGIDAINVPYGGLSLSALLFETTRAPYVVKTGDNNPIHREVPWREGNSTRTAKREDLVRLLAPIQRLPIIHIVESEFAWINRGGDGEYRSTTLLYIVPEAGQSVTIPFRYCEFDYSEGESIERTGFAQGSVNAATHDPVRGGINLPRDDEQVYLTRPGMIRVLGLNPLRRPDNYPETVNVSISLAIAEAEFRRVTVTLQFDRPTEVEHGSIKWCWRQTHDEGQA